ncbi:SigE family RNA polymerase sigma factor [Actinocorallia lasiicapitis]
MRVKRDEEFSAYVAESLPWLRRVAYLMCGDGDRADDVVQVTAERLYVKWGQATRAENLDAYVRTMLVRVFLGEQRRGWFARVRVVEVLPEGEAYQGDLEAVMDVREALAKVPARQRAALVLRYHCDLSVAEAARVLGVSEGTVKSQTARGLSALRRGLGVVEA